MFWVVFDSFECLEWQKKWLRTVASTLRVRYVRYSCQQSDKPWEDCTFSEPSFEGSESHGRCESYSPDGDGPCWSVSNFFTQWYACDFKNSKVKSEWFWNVNNYMFHNSSHQILELGVHDAKKKWVLLLLVKKMCSTKAMRMAGCSKWLNIN